MQHLSVWTLKTLEYNFNCFNPFGPDMHLLNAELTQCPDVAEIFSDLVESCAKKFR